MAGKEEQIKKNTEMEGAGRVKHVLSDGRRLDSIEGFVVPSTGPTAVVYSILYEALKRKEMTERGETQETQASA